MHFVRHIYLFSEISIMKMGQFVCLGNLQHLKNRFGKGYAVKVKVLPEKMNEFRQELTASLPDIEIEGITKYHVLLFLIFKLFTRRAK